MSGKKTAAKVLAQVFWSPWCTARCEYCQREIRIDVIPTAPNRATADHRTPLGRGGRDTESNIAIVCFTCNHAKGPLTEHEFLSLLGDQHAVNVARRMWEKRLNTDQPSYSSHTEKHLAKEERRQERLSQRLTIPDPHCEWCGGTGSLKSKHKERTRYCACALVPLPDDTGEDDIQDR